MKRKTNMLYRDTHFQLSPYWRLNRYEIDSKRAEGEKQIQEKNYATPHEREERQITAAVIVIDGEKRKVVL